MPSIEIYHVISLGIGSPAAIDRMITFGLRSGFTVVGPASWRTFTPSVDNRTDTTHAEDRTYTVLEV